MVLHTETVRGCLLERRDGHAWGSGRDAGVQRSSRSCSGHGCVLYLHQVFTVLFSLHLMYILNIILYQLNSLHIFIKGNTDIYQSLHGLSLIFGF